ncbi:sensor domain-containing protein [Actinospica durhamensis]|uniref:Sensor domain-containing protein n=1 Tax=Actinospica durhamensis TaxID=1508375 RepID=A0A941ESV0_9ACTN|nr:sensor domain-containing protein [Actinospica durhamensis]MBR7835837.1 sensor domain-containing protein [Actinospica durhamensis]
MNSRKLTYAGLVAALPLALAGCSSSNSGSTPTGAGTASSTAASTAQLTGTQLTSALLTATDVASGFTVSSNSAVDSGGSLTTTAAKYKPAGMSCADLLNEIGQTGFGESAMADNTLENDTTEELLNQAVYQFSSASAANVFFTSLQAKWNSCGSFTETDSSGTAGKVDITVASAPSGLGDMDFSNTMSASESSTTMTGTNLAVLKGSDVFIVGPGKIGSSQPSDLSAQTLVQKLMSKVSTAG